MLSRVGEIVRAHDPDRFFSALFAPAARREALFTLYAFNHELARAREVAREPISALFRLQWWREVVEGARRRHEVAEPLAELLSAGVLPRDELLAVIEGREAETAEIDTLEDWDRYLHATAGGLAVAAGQVLGATSIELERLRKLGAAFGAAGVLRSVPFLARQDRCLLPDDLLRSLGTDAAAVIAGGASGAARQVLAARGRAWLGRREIISRASVAAALPASAARYDLGFPRPGALRPIGVRLAMIVAAQTRRV